MKILVTGVTGFIGSHLCERLVELGYDVHGVVRHHPRETGFQSGVKIHVGDLLDIHSLRRIVQRVQPSCVVHLAALTPVRFSFENPFIYAETNYVGTMNMVHAALESKVLEKFIYGSTAEAYKQLDERRPLREEDPLEGSTPYGVSKAAADLYVQVAGKCFGLPYVVLRPVNTFGRKTEKGYFVEKVVTSMLTSEKLCLNGDPKVVRSFMYVDDHVDAYVKVLESNVVNEVFNVSPGVRYSLGDVVQTVKNMLNWSGEVEWGLKPRPFDPPYLVLDNSKIRRVLGWKPRYTLVEGLRKTIEYWRVKFQWEKRRGNM